MGTRPSNVSMIMEVGSIISTYKNRTFQLIKKQEVFNIIEIRRTAYHQGNVLKFRKEEDHTTSIFEGKQILYLVISENVETKLERLVEFTKNKPKGRFTSLAHLINWGILIK